MTFIGPLAPAALVAALQSARLDPALDMFYEGVAGEVGDCLMVSFLGMITHHSSLSDDLDH